MSEKMPLWKVIGLLFAMFLVMSGSPQGCSLDWLPVVGAKAPFATDKPIAVCIAFDESLPAMKALTQEQLNVLDAQDAGSIREYVKAHNGVFRKVSAPPGEFEEQWVKDAWAAKGPSLPWILASSSSGKGMSEAVPPDVKSADVAARLKQIGGP